MIKDIPYLEFEPYNSSNNTFQFKITNNDEQIQKKFHKKIIEI